MESLKLKSPVNSVKESINETNVLLDKAREKNAQQKEGGGLFDFIDSMQPGNLIDLKVVEAKQEREQKKAEKQQEKMQVMQTIGRVVPMVATQAGSMLGQAGSSFGKNGIPDYTGEGVGLAEMASLAL